MYGCLKATVELIASSRHPGIAATTIEMREVAVGDGYVRGQQQDGTRVIYPLHQVAKITVTQVN